MTSARRGPHTETPLQRTLDRLEIPSAAVESKLRERLGRTWPSRQQMARWRLGRTDVRRKDMVRILWAVREVSRNQGLQINDLFDFDTENPDNWRD